MTDTLCTALYSIPADDRETWVTMAMAIKSDRGEAGFTMWDNWSRQSDRYKAADARAVWRSVKPTGGITIATLYHMAKENGWQGDAPVVALSDSEEQRRWKIKRMREEERREHMAEHQAQYALAVLLHCEYGSHPYLVAKGFPDEKGLIGSGNLIVPMRNHATNAVQSMQMIKPDGRKLFLKGAKASEAVYKMGKGYERWYCEGYATALSVRAALKSLYRDTVSEVWVCFSAGNLTKVANRGYVIADHDDSGTGEKYTRQTGLPYWMPPDVGRDANDFHQQHGIDALADALREVLRQGL